MQLAELKLEMVMANCISLLFTAPSQPPRIISSIRSGSRYIITWDHVVALSNESTVTGYKVDKRSLEYSPPQGPFLQRGLVFGLFAVSAKPIQFSHPSCATVSDDTLLWEKVFSAIEENDASSEQDKITAFKHRVVRIIMPEEQRQKESTFVQQWLR